MRIVEVHPYHDEWPKLFEEEANKLRSIFGSEIIDIHHIGSTAVKGLNAKPVIDIMPVVRDINRIDEFNYAMIEVGYHPKGENGICGRRYFQKGNHNRTHHVHIYGEGSKEIERHLAFRDYLRQHPEDRKNYGDLKMGLANQFSRDISSYIKGKEELASQIERRALDWYKREN